MIQSRKASFVGVSSLMAVAIASLLGGCSAHETYTYRSDAYSPKTISMIDTTTKEKLLTVEIPVGYQLNMKFDSTTSTAEARGQDTLRWTVTPWGEFTLANASVVPAPPPSQRRIDMTLRAVPEARPESK